VNGRELAILLVVEATDPDLAELVSQVGSIEVVISAPQYTNEQFDLARLPVLGLDCGNEALVWVEPDLERVLSVDFHSRSHPWHS
jgi:hypothetical protein